MDSRQAIQHAQKVAKQLVQLGLSDKDTVRKHYNDYLYYMKLGFEGSFTQILHSRRVIDQRSFEVLERVIPFGRASPLEQVSAESMTSSVVQLPRSYVRGTPQTLTDSWASRMMKEEARTQGVTQKQSVGHGPASAASSTMGFEQVLRAPGQPPPSAPAETLPLERGRLHDRHEDPTVIMRDDEEEVRPERTMILPDEDLPPERPADRFFGESGEDNLTFPELERGDRVQSRSVARPGPTAKPAQRPRAPERPPAQPAQPAGGWKGRKAKVSSTAGGSDSRHPRARRPGSSSGEFNLSDEVPTIEDTPFLQPQLGGFLGEFELLDVLGQGGMGFVFKTRRPEDPMFYAIKVLRVRQSGSSEKRRKRFRREVDAMQRLKHPNVVRVHGYGRDGPFDWFVMDYVDGKDLAQLLVAGALSLDQKLQIFLKICKALAHAHDREVVHRDLKPQNILIDVDLQPHLLDFGLAKLLDDQDALTHTGSALGTPFYMSPEQVETPTQVGPRADVFALGVMLYEMISGKRPFTGKTAGEVGNKVLTIDPPKPSRINPELSPNLDAICLKALEKKKERRYQSVDELRRDLEAHIKGGTIKQQGKLAPMRRFYERNQSGMMMGILIASVFFASLALLGGMLYLVISG